MASSHRPVVMGARGMVASGHPLASDAALDILKAGGTAIDAALCASAVLFVVKSYHCGLGGDLFAIFYTAAEGNVLVLNGSGRAPNNLRRQSFATGIPHRGILAASIPGAADAWLAAADRLGSRKASDLLQAAIHYAHSGFPVFPHLRHVIRASHKTLGADPAWSRIFLPDGKIPEIGDVFVQKDLACTLDALARGGRDAFYGGEIARSIVLASERHGGCFTQEDLAQHRSRWEEPLSTTYREYEVCVPPPNSYGLLLLLQLKFLSDYNLATRDHNSPETVALQLRANEEACRAGDFWVGDPDQYRHEALAEFLRRFPHDASATTPGERAPGGRSTTYVAAADRYGNWASLIQSVHQSFGCGVVVDRTGIVLNNRMSGFNLISGHPNELAPGKLPGHTLSPALILKDGRPVLAIGTPGGLGQTQFLAQVICNLFDFGLNVQEAIEAPRWHSDSPGHVELESRFSSAVAECLSRHGYDV
ncbi:MAG TPA: gamma-glutamyltransferase family protein, partial [Candidatus Eisenbacteria bacterium]|nr:gamma-glutamyltransferase family protein [Candidatus Eisenbacteria bacterium]